MMAAAYQVDPILTGTEIFECNLPAMTKQEQAQAAGNARALAEPYADGSRFVSAETARDLAELIPDEWEEASKIRRERYNVIVAQQIADQRAQMEGQAVNTVNAQAAAAAEQQRLMQSQGNNLAARPETGNGVARSPLPESQPVPEEEFMPLPMQAGV